MAWCASCCPDCFVDRASPTKARHELSLNQLLSAGTLYLKLGLDAQQAICSHRHAEDGWHVFNGPAMLSYLSDPEDILVCDVLEFLSKNLFISATYTSLRTDGQGVLVRVYLVPSDAPGVRSLRTQKPEHLTTSRKHLAKLLPRLSLDLAPWEATGMKDDTHYLFPNITDSRSLSEIYGALPSPSPSPVPGLGDIASRLLDFEDELEGFGMRSKLYKYQRRSVATMLQHELDGSPVPDPLFIQLTAVDGKTFYLQPATMEVVLERPMITAFRGGILCEELGTGKTVMVLSLIMATRRQLPSPEPSIFDNRPVATPLSFKHFESEDMRTMRTRYADPALPHTASQHNSKVPTLVEALIHQIRTKPLCDVPNPRTIISHEKYEEFEERIQGLPLSRLIEASTPFYHHYQEDPVSPNSRPRRRGPAASPRTMYLSSATLIVVPINLVSQWEQEIHKHCETPLRILTLREKVKTPSVQELASNYDIILMTYPRFTAESASSDNISKLHVPLNCKCPTFPGTRIPQTICSVPNVSPFLQIRWKRLVIDEGHVSASLNTLLVPFTKSLSIERRWIVTGTPTTNLLGLSFGSGGALVNTALEGVMAEMDVDSSVMDTPTQATPSVSVTPSTSSHASSIIPVESSPTPLTPPPSSSSSISPPPPSTTSAPPKQRIWTQHDRQDLNKLGNMIGHFVAVPMFQADSKLMSTQVIDPLLDPTGPRPGSIQVLTQLMQMVMVRHRISEVEQDVVLPPVHQENVLLDLDPIAIKSYNALQASIAVNAVDSERKDQDYLFHPRNAHLLQATVKNMSQILFWKTDEELYNTVELNKRADEMVNKAIERNRPLEDIQLLQDACRHVGLAINDKLWEKTQGCDESIPYRVSNMDLVIYESWTRPLGKDLSFATVEAEHTGLIHGDRLARLRDSIKRKPLQDTTSLAELGRTVDSHDKALREVAEQIEKNRKKGTKRSGSSGGHGGSGGKPNSKGPSGGNDDPMKTRMAEAFVKKASAVETLREMQKELESAMSRLDDTDYSSSWSAAGPPTPKIPLPHRTPTAVSRLLANNPASKIIVNDSCSSKLNYVIREVQKYAASEKFLIFSESPLTLACVAEALELIDIKYALFDPQAGTQKQRQMSVLTFETSETYRVFLMELKHGARGLNLVSASRVIFCEPVWQADVESQAIKRAHRIGQTKPISVKTLAIRSTAEENMVNTRAALRNSHEKQAKLLDDKNMRHYIANPTFLESPPVAQEHVRFPLITVPQNSFKEPSSSNSSRSRVRISDTSPKRVRTHEPRLNQPVASSSLPAPESPPAKKIRFAM